MKEMNKSKKRLALLIPALLILVAGGILLTMSIKKNQALRAKYELALSLIEDEDSTNDEEAMELFRELGDYEDAEAFLDGFVLKTLRMEENSYTTDGSLSRQTVTSCHYDRAGVLCGVSLAYSSGERNKSTKVENFGQYTLVYYENGDIDGFLTKFPGLKLFKVRNADNQKQNVYFGQIMPAFYEYTVDFRAENGEIRLVMKPSSGEEGHVIFSENGDIRLYYQEGSEKRRESVYRCTIGENTLEYSQDSGSAITCRFDESGMLEELTKGGNQFRYEIERDSDGRTVRGTNSAGGGKEEVVWASGYVYAPEA